MYFLRIHSENAIDLFQYLKELKSKLKIERNICTSIATMEYFDIIINTFTNFSLYMNSLKYSHSSTDIYQHAHMYF